MANPLSFVESFSGDESHARMAEFKGSNGADNVSHSAVSNGRKFNSVAPARAKRNFRLAIAGILFCALGALLMVWAIAANGNTRDVVSATRNIRRGEVISGSDLASTSVGAAAGVPVVEKAEARSLVGKIARTDIPSGSLLAPQSVGDAEVDSGSAMIGLKLATGRLPAKDLPAGARVTLVEVADGGPGQEFAANVVSQSGVLDGQTKLVDVTVSSENASVVAALAAADRLALVRQADAA
ncbi:hypothetical protein HMPREF9306_00058 [Propionimicrobium lymphophilum ACS-093-V-SCH5]|uniref:SAF domain-containing protein n=1 Tax=Propionimicrobium lymphophilum ACS-093-V-SCH5 TaxID=883161 RepID=S2X1X6_9ACTN|nr:SAF domain-containing protein [Propionimicrobium lymphophilum]EPD34024.1 hypothetical protein HMPREF9306_00058 [Propionimicrobium lymphophilum ACS-093-V-SCH5]